VYERPKSHALNDAAQAKPDAAARREGESHLLRF
jgi:hypothetical protein